MAEYDSDLLDSFPRGNHLVMCYPGGSSRRFNVEPNHAAMIAAGRLAEDAICNALVKAMQTEADKLMSHPAVVDAWEKFMLTCELTKERKNGN